MESKIKQIETQLMSNERIKMPYSKKYTQELKNKIAQHNSDIIHNKKYTLKSDYINAIDKMKISCPDHGIFLQSYNNNLNGKGCPSCNIENRSLTQEQAFSNMSDFYNGFYLYHKFVYINTKTKGLIECPIHGYFKQCYRTHSRGTGCPNCSNKALFNRDQKTKLYIFKNNLDQFKVGISINPDCRINKLRRNNPFSEITQMITYSFSSFSKAEEYESLVHNELKEYNIQFDKKFNGSTEWFNCTFEQIAESINKYYKDYSLLEDLF